MSIIIYHTEQLLDRRQIEALRKFYNCDHVTHDYVYGEVPPADTLAVVRIDDNDTAAYKESGYDHLIGARTVSVNCAFSEMIAHFLANFIPECFEHRLRDFIGKQNGEIFMLDDVLIFLDIDPDDVPQDYSASLITAALKKLGCSMEQTTIFTPPGPCAIAEQLKRSA